jgi:hypothetical protein
MCDGKIFIVCRLAGFQCRCCIGGLWLDNCPPQYEGVAVLVDIMPLSVAIVAVALLLLEQLRFRRRRRWPHLQLLPVHHRTMMHCRHRLLRPQRLHRTQPCLQSLPLDTASMPPPPPQAPAQVPQRPGRPPQRHAIPFTKWTPRRFKRLLIFATCKIWYCKLKPWPVWMRAMSDRSSCP